MKLLEKFLKWFTTPLQQKVEEPKPNIVEITTPIESKRKKRKGDPL